MKMRFRPLFFSLALVFTGVVVTSCIDDETYTPNGGGGSSITYDNDTIDQKLFEIINLDYPGLEKVKSYHEAEDYFLAAKELLNYYRLRTDVTHPDVSLLNVVPTAGDQLTANNSLDLKFLTTPNNYVSYKAGTDIDWTIWPTPHENEVRYQLHRHKWFLPLAKMYRGRNDEKYMTAWQTHYSSWIANNPAPPIKLEYGNPTSYPDYVNERFAWRPLEVAHRVQEQTSLFLYFNNSKNFNPEWASLFIVNFHKQVNHIIENYTASGNHLITQAQAVVYAGLIFPEFNDSQAWLDSGLGKLEQEMVNQILDDGMQDELDLSYHIAAISDFLSVVDLAEINGKRSIFTANYLSTAKKMIDVVKHMMFPDYSVPQFNDTRKSSYSKSVLTRNMKMYSRYFPEDAELQWLATEGASGTKPTSTFKSFTTSGYYVMRNGWDKNSIMLVHQNGPMGSEGGYHCQPDNGTFELYIKGRNFYTDSGVFKYSGDAATNALRNYYRRTLMHNTMTLDNANITAQNGQMLKYEEAGVNPVLVTQNEGYPGLLTHRRAIFFVDKKFFVIVDEGIGTAAGNVSIWYHMLGENEVKTGNTENAVLDAADYGAHTIFADNNNVMVRSFSPDAITFTPFTGGKVSETIDKETPRNGCYSITRNKAAGETARFITVILPISDDFSNHNIAASFSGAYDPAGAAVTVTVDGTPYNLSYTL